jgi:hypothetical protein
MITANEKGRRAVASDRIVLKLEKAKGFLKENKNETITGAELIELLSSLQKYIKHELAI